MLPVCCLCLLLSSPLPIICLPNLTIVGLNDWIAELTDGKQHELSLQLILGYLFAPLRWLIGICPADIVHAGSLLGQKVIIDRIHCLCGSGEFEDGRGFCRDEVRNHVYLLFCAGLPILPLSGFKSEESED